MPPNDRGDRSRHCGAPGTALKIRRVLHGNCTITICDSREAPKACAPVLDRARMSSAQRDEGDLTVYPYTVRVGRGPTTKILARAKLGFVLKRNCPRVRPQGMIALSQSCQIPLMLVIISEDTTTIKAKNGRPWSTRLVRERLGCDLRWARKQCDGVPKVAWGPTNPSACLLRVEWTVCGPIDSRVLLNCRDFWFE